ncbi:MAG: AAA family ATPase [Magnetococcales bacterium]|nr:AAA family ATPase [Magnetococcales bacterium]
MYKTFFGLNQLPFSIVPNPHLLFPSQRHQEAMAHIFYSLFGANGFILLTGEVGTGKTTLCRCLTEQIPANVDTALIFNPMLSAHELISSICDELEIPYKKDTTSIKTLYDALNQHLVESFSKGRTTIVIIDEAQNLTADLLEQIRLLTNLETTTKKLLSIILIGQPELLQTLERQDLRQLAQRVTARYHITPLKSFETELYIKHRLVQAGREEPIFTGGATKLIHRYSNGTPRIINKICDRAMLGAYTKGQQRVDATTVRQAATELQHLPPKSRSKFAIMSLIVISILFLAIGKLGLYKNEVVSAYLDFPGIVSLYLKPPQDELMQQSYGQPVAKPSNKTMPIASVPIAPKASLPPYKIQVSAQAPKKDVIEKIFQLPIQKSNIYASFATVLSKWGKKRIGNEQPITCENIDTYGLSCIHLKGNWNLLRILNHPAIVKLAWANKTPRFGVITVLGENDVTFGFGDLEITLPIADVKQLLHDGITVIWQPPFKIRKFLSMGMVGEEVLWLRKQLEQIQGTPIPSIAPELFDAQLREALLSFQAKTKLQTDGVVGPLTFITLISQDKAESNRSPNIRATN